MASNILAEPSPKYTPEEHARLGKELYEKTVLPKVEAGNHGKIVAMDVDSGDFELGDTTFEAAERWTSTNDTANSGTNLFA